MLSNQFKLSDKAAGFYVASAVAVFAFITALIYQFSYRANPYYSSSVFYALLAVLPVAVVLVLLKLDNFMPAATTLLIGLAILSFIYATYLDISVVMVGIDKNSFDPEFVRCSALFGIGFVLSEISIYMKIRK